MPGPDLHLHSTFSDGLFTPEQLVARAVELHLPAIAIADHDSVGGVEPALRAAEATGLLVVPAVELSAEAGERTVHLLGYHIDHTDGSLLGHLAELRDHRRARARRIVRSLSAAGIELDLAGTSSAGDEAAIGRAHIARALVQAGFARDMADAFERFVGDHAPHFVAKSLVTPERAIEWITQAGGVAVLAHPGLSRVDDLIPSLIGAGLAGIEACHASHDPLTAERYRTLAAGLGLIVTGGSDYHGSQREGGDMGCAWAPEGSLEALLTAARTGGIR
ncbi:MAG: PHP domain-containing protein [Coriobacteriia bacterium]|nr:PHP domain-containing protein [Coriobacteriia bacterium]MBN2840924.1 PHP domain-containing protein [Coriobacteriia bacterium]